MTLYRYWDDNARVLLYIVQLVNVNKEGALCRTTVLLAKVHNLNIDKCSYINTMTKHLYSNTGNIFIISTRESQFTVRKVAEHQLQ